MINWREVNKLVNALKSRQETPEIAGFAISSVPEVQECQSFNTWPVARGAYSSDG